MPKTKCPKCGSVIEYHKAQLGRDIFCTGCKTKFKTQKPIQAKVDAPGTSRFKPDRFSLLVVIFGLIGFVTTVLFSLLIVINSSRTNVAATESTTGIENNQATIKNDDIEIEPKGELYKFQEQVVLRLIGSRFHLPHGQTIYIKDCSEYITGTNRRMMFGNAGALYPQLDGDVSVSINANEQNALSYFECTSKKLADRQSVSQDLFLLMAGIVPALNDQTIISDLREDFERVKTESNNSLPLRFKSKVKVLDVGLQGRFAVYAEGIQYNNASTLKYSWFYLKPGSEVSSISSTRWQPRR